MHKHFVFAVIVLMCMSATFFLQADPSQGIDSAMSQVNGGSQETTDFFLVQTFRSNLPLIQVVAIALTTFAFYGQSIKKAITQ